MDWIGELPLDPIEAARPGSGETREAAYTVTTIEVARLELRREVTTTAVQAAKHLGVLLPLLFRQQSGQTSRKGVSRVEVRRVGGQSSCKEHKEGGRMALRHQTEERWFIHRARGNLAQCWR